MYIFGHFVDRPHLHLSIHITHHLYSLGTWVSTLNRTNHTIYIKCTCHEQQATTYTLPSKSCNSLSHLPCTTYLPFAIQKLRFGLCFFFLTPLFSTSFSQQNTNSFLWINRTKKKNGGKKQHQQCIASSVPRSFAYFVFVLLLFFLTL